MGKTTPLCILPAGQNIVSGNPLDILEQGTNHHIKEAHREEDTRFDIVGDLFGASGLCRSVDVQDHGAIA